MRSVYLFMSLLSLGLVVLGGGCGFGAAKNNEVVQVNVQVDNISPERKENREPVRIKFTFDGQEAVADLYDTPTSRDFVAMLPLTLRFKDYNGTEKIADPPRRLSIEEAPDGFKPSVGDLTLFAPWGNLAVFYHDFQYSRGLIPIGRFTSGIELMAGKSGEFDVHIATLP